MLRNAWGRITWRITWARVSPVAVAASIWPRGTDCTPARTISNTTWRFISKLPSGALGDHPGNRKAPFHSRHDRGDCETEDQVNQSSGGQGFKRLRRVGFDLARLKGQFRDPDGQSDG